MPLSFSLDHAGPLTWTVEDAAMVLRVIAGRDPGDPASANHPIPDYRASLIASDLHGVRLGIPRAMFERDCVASEAVLRAFNGSVDVLRQLGAGVVEIELPPLALYNATAFLIVRSEGFAIHEKTLRERPQDYGALARDRLTIGAYMLTVRTEYHSPDDTRKPITAVVDVETIGTNPDRDKIIELGMCRFEYGRHDGRIYRVLGSWDWLRTLSFRSHQRSSI